MDRALEVERTMHKACVPPKAPHRQTPHSQSRTQLARDPTPWKGHRTCKSGQPRQLTGMGSGDLPLRLFISVSSVYGDLHLSDYKHTWTEGAKGP